MFMAALSVSLVSVVYDAKPARGYIYDGGAGWITWR